MSISHAINSAQSGLNVSGLRADIVATNVANATTPGYVRRSVLLSENIVGQRSAGVVATGVSRAEDAVLTGERRAMASDLSQASLLSSTWQTLSSRLGDTADGAGLFSMLSNFETALAGAATSPESGTQLAAVVDAARTLVSEFRSLSSLVNTQRGEADREIADGVDVVNAALKQVESLNGKLSRIDRNSPQAAALLDERQRTLDTIAEYLPIEAVPRGHGMIDIVTTEGVYLLSGKALEIEFTPSSAFTPSQTLANGALSGLKVGDLDLTPGASSYAAVSSGMFGALFSIRDSDLPSFGAQLDAVAEDVVTRLSADAIDPTKPPGDFGFFVDTGTPGDPGLAGRIAINPLIDPAQGGSTWRMRDGLGAATEGPPGNSTMLTALHDALTNVRTLNQSGLQGSFSSSELVAHFASLTGQARVASESTLSSANAQHKMLVQAEQAETGVDVDAQMQDLLQIEQAYAANARVIEIANKMMQRLMEMI